MKKISFFTEERKAKFFVLNDRLTDFFYNKWEQLLAHFDIKNNDPALDYMSPADRIEAESIARAAPLALYAILLFIVLALTWAAFSELERVTIGGGRVVSSEPNVVLQLEETAQIIEMNLRVGQRVAAGDVLFRVDSTLSEADRLQVANRFDSIQRELENLETERRESRAGRSANRTGETRFLDNILRLRDSIALAESEVNVSESRFKTAEEQVRMNEDLFNKKFLSRKLLLDSVDRKLDAENKLIGTKTRMNSLKRELSSLEASLNSQITELTRERDSLQQQLVKAERRSERITITSPRDAIVLEVAKLSVGSVAKATEPLVTLVPLDSSMRIETTVSSGEIAGVKVGQRVKIKLHTYPYQRYGYLEGTITNMTLDSIEVPGAQGNERVYPVLIDVDSWVFKGRSKPEVIVPGMTLTAEIITGERTVLSYLFDPLVRVVDEGMNE
jgi:hemolysin D